MIFGMPAANLVEQGRGSAEKQQLLQQFLAVQEANRNAEVTWGSDGHMAITEVIQALKDQGYWYDPDVQELLRVQDLGLPELQAAARALAGSLGEAAGDPALPAKELARRLVEWRADALPMLPALMARFVAQTAGVDLLSDPAGRAALATATAELDQLMKTDGYWQEVAEEFRTRCGPQLQPLPVWTRSHLGIQI